MPQSVPPGLVRILAVIVLYQLAPQDCETLQTLQESIACAVDDASVKILVYDNTPGNAARPALPPNVCWRASGKNCGLVVHYNEAAEMAFQEGFEWMLTLDQDSRLPPTFIAEMVRTIQHIGHRREIAAIVPRAYSEDKLISPVGLAYNVLPKFLPEDFTGISPLPWTSAINSASMVRVRAWRDVGGYDPRFPLDCSDMAFFHRLTTAGYEVFAAGSVRIEHELSLMDMKHRLTPQRYRDILGAESAFWDEYMRPAAHLALAIRYAYRICYGLWSTGGNVNYLLLTLRFGAKRLVFSRGRRMREWDRNVQRRFGDVPS